MTSSICPPSTGGLQGGGSRRSHGIRWGVAIALGVVVVLSVFGALWVNRPFQAELGSYRTSLADRTEPQRQNIRRAVISLDRVVIEPGETFSFNETVGPRTPERGYREAPAFMERDLVTSFGGGICQVSSTVYNAAALSGLEIIERHPHSRQVASVPPGRDATVWYGMTDLRFKNAYPNPVRFSVKVESEALIVAMRARRAAKREIVLRTEPVTSTIGNIAFQTVRTTAIAGSVGAQEVLSFDTYAN